MIYGLGSNGEYENQLTNRPILFYLVNLLPDKKWDAFICHASEDKADVARPLAEMLQREGLKIWYDEFTLKIGDRLNRSIDNGLANSRYGIVIISPSFFLKEWPLMELEGLVAREIQGSKIILPVRHDMSHEKLVEYSPVLAGIVAANTKHGLDKVARDLIEVINPPPNQPNRGPTKTPEVPAKYLLVLRNGNDKERKQAARKLKEYNQPSVVAALLDAVKYDWKVRYEALLSLYELKSKSALNIFVERLEDPSSRIRHVSILALGEIGEPSDVEPLQKIIDTNDFSFLNKPGRGKGARTNWGRSENVLAAKNAILSIQKNHNL
jgi:hypothetical protein